MELRWKVKVDDREARAILKKLQKDTANGFGLAMEKAKSIDSGNQKIKEAIALTNKQEKATKSLNAELSKSPRLEINNSQPKPSSTTTGALVNSPSKQDLINQFKELTKQQEKQTALFKMGRMSASQYNAVVDAMSSKQGELRKAIADYDKAQEAAAGATDKVAKREKERVGILQRLNAELKTYKEQKTSATTAGEIEAANKQIQLYEAERKRLDALGTTSGSKRPDSDAGLVQKKQYVAELYKQMALETNNDAIRAKYNKKLQETTAEVTRLGNVGKTGFDAMGNAIKGNTNLLGKLWGGLKTAANILPGVGIAGLLAFAIEPIMNFIAGLDLFKKKAKSAENAQRDIGEAMGEAGAAAARATLDVELMTQKFEQARSGILKKKDVLDEYNKGIGKTLGYTNDLNTAEERTLTNGQAYIDLMFQKAEAAAMMGVYQAKMAKAAEELATHAPGYVCSGIKDFWHTCRTSL